MNDSRAELDQASAEARDALHKAETQEDLAATIERKNNIMRNLTGLRKEIHGVIINDDSINQEVPSEQEFTQKV